MMFVASWRYYLKYKQENVTKNVGSKCTPFFSDHSVDFSKGSRNEWLFPCLAAGFGLFTNPMTG